MEVELDRSALDRGVRQLLEQHELRIAHVLHVRDLAMRLFDLLSAAHGLHSDAAPLLDAAACLHDIGWSLTLPDGGGHHKASARLIREHDWSGVPRDRVELIALVARYHRKAEPDPVRHPDYAAMSETDRYRIDWLAGILRVADGLDRGHEQRVRTVRAIRLSEQRVVEAVGMGGMEEEISGARKKSGLLATVWGGPVVIRWVSE